MSLRDQLLKAGLADKKKVSRANRELKKARKKQQGGKESHAVVRARQAAADKAARQARVEKAREEHALLVAAKEAAERRKLVKRLLRTWQLPDRQGQQLFFHKAADGVGIVRCMLPASWVYDLRRGQLAVAWAGLLPADPEYVVVRHEAARRVATMDPQRLLFWNGDNAPDEDDPALQPYDMGDIADSRERVPDRWSWLR